MFGWFKKRETPRLVVVARRDPIREEQERVMRMRMENLQERLGFHPDDDIQRWLRLHEILMDHEERIKQLERKE